jgi:hypothetical protein
MSMENTAVVIKSAGDDFSVYLPDRNADPKVRKLEDSFIAYDLGKTTRGYETTFGSYGIKRRFSFSYI